MKYIAAFLFITASICQCFAQLEAEVYFNKLKEFNFNNITSEIPYTKGDINYELLDKLALLYENEDQLFESSFYNFAELQNPTTKTQLYATLLEAKTAIVFNNSTVITFNKLLKAQATASENKYTILQKEIDIAILEILKHDLVQLNQDYTEILTDYKNLLSDGVDEAKYKLQEIAFLSRAKEIDKKTLKKTLEDVQRILEKIPNGKNLEPFLLFEKAIFHSIYDNPDTAKMYYLKIIETTPNTGYNRYINYGARLKLSEIYSQQNNLVEAFFWLEETKKYNSKANPQRTSYYYFRNKARYFQLEKKYDSAYYHLNYVGKLKDTLHYTENTFRRSEALVVNQTFEKEKALLISEKEKDANRNIAIGLAGSLCGIILISVLVYKNTKKKQRIAEQERELEIQKKEKILKDQELTTIDAIISGQEKERQRLASDLHDSVGATLAAAKLQFHHLSKNRDKGQQTEELFTKTGKLLDDAYTEIRSMAHVKNSGVIAKNGLLPAVQKLAKNASGINGLQIEVEDFGLEERLENSLEITVFRIIQELVTNIIKHSQATEASISINQYTDSLNIIVEDNGIGFDVRTSQKNDGMGLNSLEKRIEHIEGTLEIDTTLEKGTTILIDIPL